MEQKPAFDKNTILVIILCIGVWWLWQQHLQQKYPDSMSGQVSVPADQAAPSGAQTESGKVEGKIESDIKAPGKVAEVSNVKEEFKTYEDQDWRAVISSRGGRIAEVELKKYSDKKGDNVKLLSQEFPGFLLVGAEGNPSYANLSSLNYQIKEVSPEIFELTAKSDGITVKKTLTFAPNKFIVHAKVEFSGDVKSVKKINVDIAEPIPPMPDNHGPSFLSPRTTGEIQEYFFSHATKNTRELVTSKDAVVKNFDQTHFAALGSRYFTTVLYNRGGVLPEAFAFRRGNTSILRFSYPVLDSSAANSLDFDLYAGPKSVQLLSEIDESASKVVDFGFFSVIAVPLLQVMKWFNGIFKNYGLAIISLTILVRMITFPFTYMSYKSMKAMQQIQPQIARLKEVYKNNTTQLNQEMMKLMRENKVNPMGGCLPMLLQLPVFWALYQVLQNSIELYHSPFYGWIHDLSMKDPYFVLPILMGLSMFVQQKITPNTMDPAQAKVMLIMPVLFSFLMISLPSGLTLYIFVSTLFGILQQTFMMRAKTPSITFERTSNG